MLLSIVFNTMDGLEGYIMLQGAGV